MPISQCDQESIHYWHLLSPIDTVLIRPATYWETTQDYILLNGVQEEDSKWEQMISL